MLWTGVSVLFYEGLERPYIALLIYYHTCVWFHINDLVFNSVPHRAVCDVCQGSFLFQGSKVLRQVSAPTHARNYKSVKRQLKIKKRKFICF